MEGLDRDCIDDSEYEEISPLIKSWFQKRKFELTKDGFDDICFTKDNLRIPVAIYAPNETRGFHHVDYPVMPSWMIMASKWNYSASKGTWIQDDTAVFESEIANPQLFKKLKKFIKNE